MPVKMQKFDIENMIQLNENIRRVSKDLKCLVDDNDGYELSNSNFNKENYNKFVANDVSSGKNSKKKKRRQRNNSISNNDVVDVNTKRFALRQMHQIQQQIPHQLETFYTNKQIQNPMLPYLPPFPTQVVPQVSSQMLQFPAQMLHQLPSQLLQHKMLPQLSSQMSHQKQNGNINNVAPFCMLQQTPNYAALQQQQQQQLQHQQLQQQQQFNLAQNFNYTYQPNAYHTHLSHQMPDQLQMIPINTRPFAKQHLRQNITQNCLLTKAVQREKYVQRKQEEIRVDNLTSIAASGVAKEKLKHQQQQKKMNNVDEHLVVDWSQLEFQIKNKNFVFRLLAIFFNTHLYLHGVQPFMHTEDLSSDHSDELAVHPRLTMPHSYNVQEHVRVAISRCGKFYEDLCQRVEAARDYNAELYMYCVEHLQQLKRMIDKLTDFKNIDICHKWGKYLAAIDKERAEALEKVLEQLNSTITETHVHVHIFQWAAEQHEKLARNSHNQSKMKPLELFSKLQINVDDVATKSEQVTQLQFAQLRDAGSYHCGNFGAFGDKYEQLMTVNHFDYKNLYESKIAETKLNLRKLFNLNFEDASTDDDHNDKIDATDKFSNFNMFNIDEAVTVEMSRKKGNNNQKTKGTFSVASIETAFGKLDSDDDGNKAVNINNETFEATNVNVGNVPFGIFGVNNNNFKAHETNAIKLNYQKYKTLFDNNKMTGKQDNYKRANVVNGGTFAGDDSNEFSLYGDEHCGAAYDATSHFANAAAINENGIQKCQFMLNGWMDQKQEF